MNYKLGEWLILILTVLVIGGVLTSAFFYMQYKRTRSQLNDSTVLSDSEVTQLTTTVGKLIELPQGEIPTVATVTDVELLKDQPFFARAQQGDRVLIYKTAKKAILYDPVANRIRDVGPVNIDNTIDSTESASIDEQVWDQVTPTLAP